MVEVKLAPEVGQFVVIRDEWGAFYVEGPATRLTAQRVYHPSRYGNKRETFSGLDRTLAAGDEVKMRLLADRLTSSRDLCKQDQHKARVRHDERVLALLAGER
jgi:hypothetical protein